MVSLLYPMIRAVCRIPRDGLQEVGLDSERETLPVLAGRNTVVYPGRVMPLRVGRKKSLAAVDLADSRDGEILVVAQKKNVSRITPGVLYSIGTLCRIEKMAVHDQEKPGKEVVLKGLRRVTLLDVHEESGMIKGNYDILKDTPDLAEDDPALLAMISSVKDLAIEILELVPADTSEMRQLVEGIDDPALLIHMIAENIEGPLSAKQEILEERSVLERGVKLTEMMARTKNSLTIQSRIRDNVTRKINKSQRESMLREHIQALQEELDTSQSGGRQKNSLLKKIKAAGMPAETEEQALEELDRMNAMGKMAPESHVIATYLDLLVALPWNKSGEDRSDLEFARKVLEQDHYGLEDVKKRVLQHLAVMELRKGRQGNILLLTGPPGVGKTSLGKSIATALGRRFVRFSLGGMRDDSGIRGHRRTYVGAMPGQIIQGLKRAGENNPVFLLDEIDKLSQGITGDPAAALLEVLDPEQNNAFVDHYLDVPFDLSRVFFIATANDPGSIPPALRDRMEVIPISGYTTAEKLHIAKNHLIPDQLKDHGLEDAGVRFQDEAVMEMISGYTREAGVRELKRIIGAVVRESAEKTIVSRGKGEDQLKIDIDAGQLVDILGPEKYTIEVTGRMVPPGVVTGLAWTPVGGEILFVEAGMMPGTGKLILTGQLGDVMKESVNIALSLLRSRFPSMVPDLSTRDLHIHVPAGAIPKDGPSAGVTMLTALASLFSGRSVPTKVAMTGEITLRGAVMPVGGIKEKILAAKRAGVERIILCHRNEKDLRDLPDGTLEGLRIEFVEMAGEILKKTMDLDEEFAADFAPLARTPAGNQPENMI